MEYLSTICKRSFSTAELNDKKPHRMTILLTGHNTFCYICQNLIKPYI